MLFPNYLRFWWQPTLFKLGLCDSLCILLLTKLQVYVQDIYISTINRAEHTSKVWHSTMRISRIESQIWSSRLRKAKQNNDTTRDYFLCISRWFTQELEHSEYTEQEVIRSRYLKYKTSSKPVQDQSRQEVWRPGSQESKSKHEQSRQLIWRENIQDCSRP